MVELKVNVDGVQRIICGVSDATRCQDIIIALAQATGQIGRFNLVEKCGDSERLLRPLESPLRAMAAWGPNSRDAYFLLRRTGDTPGNSRPPSATKEIGERLRQVASPTNSCEDFTQKRSVSVRRSQTFSGYRGAEKSSDVVRNSECHELSRVVTEQQERLSTQSREMEDIEALIATLRAYESLGDVESELEEIELRSRRNKAELREMEFWENELEIERQLEADLTREIGKVAGRIADCERILLLRLRDGEDLAQKVDAEIQRGRQEVDGAVRDQLAEVRDEIALLEEEYKGYTEKTQQVEAEIEGLDETLALKRSEETRLTNQLAMEKLKVDITPAAGQPTQYEARSLPRQRAQSTSPEISVSPSAYATFPFRRLISARPLASNEPSTDSQDGIFV